LRNIHILIPISGEVLTGELHTKVLQSVNRRERNNFGFEGVDGRVILKWGRFLFLINMAQDRVATLAGCFQDHNEYSLIP
jgi:hypothetical protein